MAQIANTRQVLPFRPTPKTDNGVPAPVLDQPRIARPWRLTVALKWLYHMLFVRPVGRRARHEGLHGMGDHALRDIGLRRSDVGGSASGMVSLERMAAGYPSAGPLVVPDQPPSPKLVRLNRAA